VNENKLSRVSFNTDFAEFYSVFSTGCGCGKRDEDKEGVAQRVRLCVKRPRVACSHGLKPTPAPYWPTLRRGSRS
jgi:hypothetical protein